MSDGHSKCQQPNMSAKGWLVAMAICCHIAKREGRRPRQKLIQKIYFIFTDKFKNKL